MLHSIHDGNMWRTVPRPVLSHRGLTLPSYHPTQAVALRSANLRFDLCSKEGPPTTDLGALLAAAALPWQK